MATKPQHRKQQVLVVRSLGSFVIFLLLQSGQFARRTPPAAVRGRFVLAAKLPDIAGLAIKALHTLWLGPGLVLAFVLLVTLRGRRRAAYKPLHRNFRMPKLERYQGEIPKRHRDLEI